MEAKSTSTITDAIIRELRASLSTLYFTPSDFFILRKIVYLSILHGHNSPNRTIYSTPGERWLAKNTGLHRVTVSRRISYLSQKGFLAITYRRKVEGQWQTNLYRFGKVLWALIKDVTHRFRSFFHRVTPMLHIVSLMRVNNTKSVNCIEHDTDLQELLTKIEAKIAFNDVSPPIGKEENA